MSGLQEIEGPLEVEVTPVYVALVDTTGGEEYLELVKSALLAALEALPASALFGLATYSNQVHHCSIHEHLSWTFLQTKCNMACHMQSLLPLHCYFAPLVSAFRNSEFEPMHHQNMCAADPAV